MDQTKQDLGNLGTQLGSTEGTQLTAQLGAQLAKSEILGGLLGNGGSWEIG